MDVSLYEVHGFHGWIRYPLENTLRNAKHPDWEHDSLDQQYVSPSVEVLSVMMGLCMPTYSILH